VRLASASEAADSAQRQVLVAGIFEQLEAEASPEGTIRAVPFRANGTIHIAN
jgi:hypothetical protein